MCVPDGGHLRHAYAGDNSGGANGTGSDADFDRVDSGFNERFGAFRRRDVSRDQFALGEIGLGGLDGIDHARRMSMGRIDGYDVRAGRQKRFDARFPIDNAHGCAHPQASERILAGVGKAPDLFNVLDGDKPFKAVIVIDDEQFFDAVFVEELFGFFESDIGFNRHQLVLGHDVGHRLIQVFLEPQIPVRQNADQLFVFHHRHAGDGILMHQGKRFADFSFRLDGDRIDNHAAFRFLHAIHFDGLSLDAHVAVNDADAAFLRHADGRAGFRHRIHGRRDDGNIQRDVSRQIRRRVDITRQNIGRRRNQKQIVKG